MGGWWPADGTKGFIASVCVKYSECIWINTCNPERFGQRFAKTLCRLFTAPVFSQNNENGASRRGILKLWGQEGKTGSQLITKCYNVITGAASDEGWLWEWWQKLICVFCTLLMWYLLGRVPAIPGIIAFLLLHGLQWHSCYPLNWHTHYPHGI